MELSQIIPHIEALIFASDRPLGNAELLELLNNALGFIEDRATIEQVDAAIEGIAEKYSAEFYAFELRQSGGGWQFLTKGAYHKTIAQLNGDKFIKRLSAAAMETLAIIAYKQPITKGEIESIRGVNCDYVVQKLLEKELVVISGRNEELPGKPLVYATSRSFMDYFGINSPDDLPKIREVLADQMVQPTLVNASHFEVEEESNLVVGENGELLQQTTVTIENAGEDASPETAANQASDDPLGEERPTAEAPDSSGAEDAENNESPAEEDNDNKSDL